MILSYLQNIFYIIQGYILWAYDEVSGHATERSIKRLEICNKCEYNHNGICQICGCILKAKTRVDFMLDETGKSIDGCPELKW